MNGNAELLNYIYQNTQMGIKTINKLIPLIEDESFKNELNMHLNDYMHYHTEAKRILHELGHDEKGISLFEKMVTYTMISMKTLTNRSSCHIASMMMNGTNMGIIDLIKNIRKYPHARADIIQLTKDLLLVEEKKMERLKTFL